MGAPPLLRLKPSRMRALGEKLTIKDKETSRRVPWRWNAAQVKACLRSNAPDRLTYQMHGKPRQVGLSTYFCYEDVLWTNSMAKQGAPVICAILLDTGPKASRRLDQCEDFARQLGLPVQRRAASSKGPERLEWTDGSSAQIWALGADGNRVGSSDAIDRLHMSETPYFKRPHNTFGSIMQSLADHGEVRIETTIDATDILCRELRDDREWALHFTAVEDVARYREDPDDPIEPLADGEWEALKKEGYTDKWAAAWFSRTVGRKFAGDRAQAFNQFPQLVDHMFAFATGRFIRGLPRLARAKSVLSVEGESSDFAVLVYKEPVAGREYALGVDTAEGGSDTGDRSSVVVTDVETDELVAEFSEQRIWGDDLARVVKRVQDHYTTREEPVHPTLGQPPPATVPVAVVEKNGVGAETLHACQRLGVALEALHMDAGKRMSCLLLARSAIQAGKVAGSKRLRLECDRLNVDEKTGRFKGPKDTLMALGMAYRYGRSMKFAPEDAEDSMSFSEQLMRRLKAEARRRRY